MNAKCLRYIFATLYFVACCHATAALIPRGGGMVYDTDRNVTWMQDWSASGLMNWSAANTWAANLTFGGYDDWRLPNAGNLCGSNSPCVQSELGHLYFTELGNVVNNTGQPMAFNVDPFYSVHSFNYWTGPQVGPGAYVFLIGYGTAAYFGVEAMEYAVAIRDGDVPSVPEPATAIYIVAGLVTLALLRRRR